MRGRSVSKTYRIRDDVLEEIDRRAGEYRISSSQLVNHWLTKCLMLDPLWKHLNAVTIGRDTLAAIIELAEKDDLEKSGRDLGTNIAKQLFTLYDVEPNWSSVIYALDETYSNTCRWFEFKHHTKEETHHLIFRHELGANWSSFLKGYIRAMLKSLLNIEPKINATDTMLELIA